MLENMSVTLLQKMYFECYMNGTLLEQTYNRILLPITIKAMMIIAFRLTPYLGVVATQKMWLQPCHKFYNGDEFLYLSLFVAEVLQ